MKTQKRNFVVEIKSSRRRPRPEAKSIWGDTDFKALSREAEAAHFLLNGPSLTTLKPEEQPSDSKSATPAPSADIEVLECFAGSYGAEETSISDRPALADARAAEFTKPARSIEVSSRRRQTVLSGASRKPRSRPPSALEAATEEVVSADDISLLEAENRQLTLSLAQHLREQNLQLRKMIERVERANA